MGWNRGRGYTVYHRELEKGALNGTGAAELVHTPVIRLAQDKRLDYAYNFKLKKGKNKADLVNALNRIESVNGVSLLLQETTIDL